VDADLFVDASQSAKLDAFDIRISRACKLGLNWTCALQSHQIKHIEISRTSKALPSSVGPGRLK